MAMLLSEGGHVIVQSNTSCCVDVCEAASAVAMGTNRISCPNQNQKHLITDKQISLMHPLDDTGKSRHILLENLLQQLSKRINYFEETRKINVDCQLIPINVPLSEISLVNYEIIDFTDFHVSFSCINNYTNVYFPIYCKGSDKGTLQFGNGNFILNDNMINFGCDVEGSAKGKWQDMKTNSSLLIRSISHRNVVFIGLNLPLCASILQRPSTQCLHCAHISTETGQLNFFQTFQFGTNFASHLSGTVYMSLFDKIKLYVGSIQTIFSMTLSINQAFVFAAATFPVKNSGFDFYSKGNLQIKELPFRMEIHSDISSLKTLRSGSSDQDCLHSSQQNSYNSAFFSRFQTSVPCNQQIISLLNNNFSRDESVSSKCSIRSFQSKADESFCGNSSRCLLKQIPTKVERKGDSNGIAKSLCNKSIKTFSSNNNYERDCSQGTVTEMKSKYLLTEQSSNVNNLVSKIPLNLLNKLPKTRIKNNSFKLSLEGQINDCSVSTESNLLPDSILHECLSIVDSSVNALAYSVAFETWNIKSLSTRQGLKPCQFASSGDPQSQIRNNYQNYILNRRNKVGFNRNVSSSIRENKFNSNNTFSNPCQRRNGFTKARENATDRFCGPNICDLITSQSLFGQPPKSCFKSKLSDKNKLQEIRNLSWDFQKLNRKKVQQVEENENFNNNRSVKLDSVNEPASIFEYAKARCLSADLGSKINLTNEDLIKASKQPFSHSNFLKTLKEDLSKRSCRLSAAPFVNNVKATKSYLNRKRVQSNHNRNAKDSKPNNSKFNYRVTEQMSRNLTMNRFKTSNKAGDTGQDLLKQQGRLLLFSQNRRKEVASLKSHDSNREGKNIFSFS